MNISVSIDAFVGSLSDQDRETIAIAALRGVPLTSVRRVAERFGWTSPLMVAEKDDPWFTKYNDLRTAIGIPVASSHDEALAGARSRMAEVGLSIKLEQSLKEARAQLSEAQEDLLTAKAKAREVLEWLECI